MPCFGRSRGVGLEERRGSENEHGEALRVAFPETLPSRSLRVFDVERRLLLNCDGKFVKGGRTETVGDFRAKGQVLAGRGRGQQCEKKFASVMLETGCAATPSDAPKLVIERGVNVGSSRRTEGEGRLERNTRGWPRAIRRAGGELVTEGKRCVSDGTKALGGRRQQKSYVHPQ